MKIDVDELLKILPQLIRENDTVKGAIITALSGVVATREDIKEIIKEMDKRFEAVDKRFEAMQQQIDKRFEAMQQQIDKRFEAVDRHFEMVHVEIADQTRVIGILKDFLEKNMADLHARQGRVEQFMEEMRDYLRDNRDKE